MAYPNQPNFGIAEQDSAWWKIRNPRAGAQFTCSTNGAGFVGELKRYLASWLQSRSLWNQRIPRADLTGFTAASQEAITNTSRWSEGTVSALAAWFRVATGGNVVGNPSPGGVSLPNDADLIDAEGAIRGMPRWALDLHNQLTTEFRAQRVGYGTLQVAVWCLVYHRDAAAGNRLGGSGAGVVGTQVTPFADIVLQSNVIGPPWDRDLPGPAQAISCTSETERVDITRTTGQQASGQSIMGMIQSAFDTSSFQMNDWLRVGLVAAAGGYVGHQVIGKRSRKRRGRK